MIAATVTCAAAATEASAQDSSIINGQLNLGDVVPGQTLDVRDQESVQVSVAGQGNDLRVGFEDVDGEVRWTQTMRGGVRPYGALTLNGDTGRVEVEVQGSGNYLAAGAEDADMSVQATQDMGDSSVVVRGSIDNEDARLLEGGRLGVAANGNVMALGAENGLIEGAIDQISAASVDAGTFVASQYIPARMAATAQALGNALQSTGTGVSDARLGVRQQSYGQEIVADVSANSGNAWDLAGRARATANQIVVHNAGGAIVSRSEQISTSDVEARARVTAYDYGRAEAAAEARGNAIEIGNNDRYVEIDNAQFNSGGVLAQSEFSGAYGYDVIAGANAAGNVAVGYACADCPSELYVNNDQVNTGPVTATTTVQTTGGGRATVVGVNAVGNSASFYVTGPRN